MEDALRVHFWQAYGTSQRVLILVLMEDALREYLCEKVLHFDVIVLILVLMEDALRVHKTYA